MTNFPSYVVFIDFDGVTHPVRGHIPKSVDGPMIGTTWFRPFNVGQVNRLLCELDAVGVITSAWRFDFPWEAFQGFFEGRLVGEAPLLGGVQKHADCRRFLEDKGWQSVPWVAIDDKPSLFAPDDPVIATNLHVGLTDRDVNVFLDSIKRPTRFDSNESLRENYCTACHRLFAAVYRPFKEIVCPACGVADERLIWHTNTFGFMYYQRSEEGRAEMQRAQLGCCFDDGLNVLLLDSSPLSANASVICNLRGSLHQG